MASESYIVRYVEADPERGQSVGAEYSVATVAVARKHHPRAAIVGRTEIDARGNATTRPYAGAQYWDREPAPVPLDDDPPAGTAGRGARAVSAERVAEAEPEKPAGAKRAKG